MNMSLTGEILIMQMNDANIAFMTEEGREMATEEQKFNRPRGSGLHRMYTEIIFCKN